MKIKDKAQSIFDAKVNFIHKLDNKIKELNEVISEIGVEDFDNKIKDKSFNSEEIDTLYEFGTLTNLIKNKAIDAINFRDYCKSLNVELDTTELAKIQNIMELEVAYKKLLESQEFFKLKGDTLEVDEGIKSENLDSFLENLYKGGR